MRRTTVYLKKLALVTVISSLGAAIAPLSWFVFLGTKANPTQHVINAILGVLLGPFWAALAAIFTGTIRNLLGIGTIYAFPGGIPGGVIVGVIYWILKRLKVSEKTRAISALTEPVGTLLIGAPLALFLVAPWMGTQALLNLTAENGALLAFLIFGSGWALSCIPGSTIGLLILFTLNKAGYNRKMLFGEE
jgi:energy coupling factor transporter S component ThiW